MTVVRGLADSVYQLGGMVRVGPDVSWCPEDATGWQPVNAYAIARPGQVVLVDTGIGLHVDELLAGLRELLGPGDRLSVVLTRTEMECCLNLPAIEREFEIDKVWYTGGITVPVSGAELRRIQIAPGTYADTEVADGLTLRLYSPRLRLLPVLWVGDLASGVLMTSDGFSHVLTDAQGTPVADDGRWVREMHLRKFGWLGEATGADVDAVADNVVYILGDHPWTVIAPTYGAPIVGTGAVARHAGLVVACLKEMRRRAA